MKIVVGVVGILILLASSTVSAVQKSDDEYPPNAIVMYSGRGSIYYQIGNYGNESLNYTFGVAFIKPIYLIKNQTQLLDKILPGVIYENGTVPANSTVENEFKVRRRFCPVVVVLETENNLIMGLGFVSNDDKMQLG